MTHDLPGRLAPSRKRFRFRDLSAIWQQFRRWRASGVWEKALTLLRRAVRTKAGRDPEPSMVMLDCQTVKGGRGGPGFHEAGRKYGGTLGAKRTVLIDYLGLPVAARVDSARPHDSKAGRTLLDDSLPDLPRVGEVLADLGHDLAARRLRRLPAHQAPTDAERPLRGAPVGWSGPSRAFAIRHA